MLDRGSAIRQELQIRLHRIIYLQEDFYASHPFAPPSAGSLDCSQRTVQPDAIVLKRIGQPTPILYACAIAHRLAAQHHCQLLPLAEQIAESVRHSITRHQALLDPPFWFDAVWQNLTIRVTPEAMIQIQFSDRAVAAFLTMLIDHSLNLPPDRSSQNHCREPLSSHANASSLFAVQLAHARCCSLLRLGDRTGLIHLHHPLELTPAFWQFSAQDVVVWLTPDARLQVDHPSESNLISHLVMALDELPRLVTSPSQADKKTVALKLANDVSTAFQQFYQSCPLWGHLDAKSGDRNHARFGLLMATQRVLCLLLEDGLNSTAPAEL